MSQQTINQGNPPIVWSTIDDAFQKINANFTELYLSIGGSGVDLSNISSDLIPDGTLTRDLGSISRRWRDLYLGGSSIYLGDALITADITGAVNLPSGSTVGGSLIKDPTTVSFGQISVAGQGDVLANSETGVINFAGSGVNIITDPGTDTVTFSNAGVTSLIGSTGISVSSATGTITLSNTGVRSAIGGTGISVNTAFGDVTFTNTGVTSLVTDPGSGISLDASTGTINITNSAPNIIQPVHRFIAVPGNPTLDAPGPNGTLTFSTGYGIQISTDSFTNSVVIGLQSRIDIKGSIFSDDSTILVDGTNGLIPASVVQGTFTGNVVGTLTGSLVGTMVGDVTGDLKGSVVADNSTVLVDGTNGKVIGDILTSSLRTSETEIALGFRAGDINQGLTSVAIGEQSGYDAQGNASVAIGSQAGKINQGASSVAIGPLAGISNQNSQSVAVGNLSGNTSQGQYAVAIGSSAGSVNQGNNAIAIGSSAGVSGQGVDAIAIGTSAGALNQPANSIIINATGLAVNGAESGFYVDPIREVTGPQVLYYDPSGTKEVTWGPVPSGGGGGGGGGDFELNVAAEDSTIIRIYSGETLQFAGSSGIQTTSDTEGKITVGFDPSGNISMGTTGTIEIFGVASSQVYIGGGTGGGTSGDVNLGNGTNTIVFASATSGISYNDLSDLPGGSGLASRSAPTGSTGSIADTATANVTITGFKGYLLYKIQTSAAAWVRVYTSTAARTADSGRAEGVDPSPGAGVIAEVITTGAETILITPGAIGFNDESPVDTDIKLAVTNKSGAPADITVTLTVVKVED